MLGLPEAASEHAANIDQMIEIIHWFVFILAAVWGTFYVYCLIRFRAKANPKANYYGVRSHAGSYLEAGVVAFEAFLLLAFAFPLWRKWVVEFPAKEQAEVVKIVAEQFAWNIHYPGADGKFGKGDIKLIDVESNPLGLDRKNDPAAADDIVTLNQLHLPVNKPALIFLSSKDVIHSFKLVEMRVTQDAVPGNEIPLSFTPIKAGKYEIACAQLCGLGHYRMKGFMSIDTPAEFEKWKAEQGAAAAAGAGEEVW